jgi:hemerythrin-like domain-containing protein
VDFQSKLGSLFSEEDAARHMARALMETAKRSREAASAERTGLLAFLHGPMEKHMEYEERSLFPRLEEKGLGPEVQVATKQHERLRELRDELDKAPAGSDVAQLVFDVARLMLHHTNFEGDYIYPELGKQAWMELMEETIA